jgi:hypothetical protein
MSCCGQKRAQLYSNLPAPAAGRTAQAAPPPPAQAAAPVPILFEYLGATAVSAIGPVTRRLYRFDRPHARVAVDARDASSIAAVPNLQRVR